MDRVLFLGKVENDTLSQCYAGADCLLFPLVPIDGDVEGFGMVAIVAGAHGTPRASFAEGGVVDAVNDGMSGSLVAPGDYDTLIDILAKMGRDSGNLIRCQSHALKFSWQVFDGNILRSIRNLLSD